MTRCVTAGLGTFLYKVVNFTCFVVILLAYHSADMGLTGQHMLTLSNCYELVSRYAMPCHLQCSKSRRNKENRRHRYRRFLKSSAKIGENRKNSAETHRWRNSENWEHQNAAGFGDKSAGFTDKPVRRVSDGFSQKPADFLPKFGKWNEKTIIFWARGLEKEPAFA
jgi:hypothetical protein